MELLLATYTNNPNIGLYGLATDEFCLLPRAVSKRLQADVQRVLNVPVFCCNIAGTELIGALCVGNGKKLLVPGIIFDDELEILKKTGLQVSVLDTELTALGNNIAVGNGKAVLSLEYSDDEVKAISKALDVKAKKMSVIMLNTLGSLMSVSKSGGVVHQEIGDVELAGLQKFFGVKLVRATVNQGNPYVSIGIMANKNGVVIGRYTAGAEITSIEEGFGIITGLPGGENGRRD